MCIIKRWLVSAHDTTFILIDSWNSARSLMSSLLKEVVDFMLSIKYPFKKCHDSSFFHLWTSFPIWSLILSLSSEDIIWKNMITPLLLMKLILWLPSRWLFFFSYDIDFLQRSHCTLWTFRAFVYISTSQTSLSLLHYPYNCVVKSIQLIGASPPLIVF